MGNFTSCFKPNNQSAKLIDGQGNLRHFKVPITAAEIMLFEQPGYLVSPIVDDLRSSFRLSALGADDMLSNGKLYYLIPVSRLNSFVTEPELDMLRASVNKVKLVKRRRNSKVLPEGKSGGATVEGSNGNGNGNGNGNDNILGDLQESLTSQRVCSSPMWKPVLEPIYE